MFLNKLIKIANELDEKGAHDEADELDSIILDIVSQRDKEKQIDDRPRVYDYDYEPEDKEPKSEHEMGEDIDISKSDNDDFDITDFGIVDFEI